MIQNNYFFFDGSSLISEIRALQKSNARFADRRVVPASLVSAFDSYSYGWAVLGRPSFRRAVFYFTTEDPQVEKFILIPNFEMPGNVMDLSFKWCGQRLKMPAGYDEWCAQQPEKYQQFCSKREKGVDVEICCDALQLAALRNLDRLILLTNDSDFIPLCEKLKSFGSNVSLIHLSEAREVNKELVSACDSYRVLDESQLDTVFEV